MGKDRSPECIDACFSSSTLFKGRVSLPFRLDVDIVQRLSRFSVSGAGPVQSSVMPLSDEVGTGCIGEWVTVEGLKSSSDATI
jgi:hypothetical protein